MRKFWLLTLPLAFSFNAKAQEARIIKLDELTTFLTLKSDTTYLINFWATWCKPCIEEMPHFLETEKELSGKNYRFIFISLDFKRQYENLNKWLQTKKMHSEVYLIDEQDYNKWINLVDSSWEGNIPATLIYNPVKNKRIFKATELSKTELQDLLKL
jgi:thiol-disulfide isomerase/thioredoxin